MRKALKRLKKNCRRDPPNGQPGIRSAPSNHHLIHIIRAQQSQRPHVFQFEGDQIPHLVIFPDVSQVHHE